MTDNVVPLPPPFVEERVALILTVEFPDDVTRTMEEGTIDGRPMTLPEKALLGSCTTADLEEARRRRRLARDAAEVQLDAMAIVEEHVLPLMERDGITLPQAVALVPGGTEPLVLRALTVLGLAGERPTRA